MRSIYEKIFITDSDGKLMKDKYGNLTKINYAE